MREKKRDRDRQTDRQRDGKRGRERGRERERERERRGGGGGGGGGRHKLAIKKRERIRKEEMKPGRGIGADEERHFSSLCGNFFFFRNLFSSRRILFQLPQSETVPFNNEPPSKKFKHY